MRKNGIVKWFNDQKGFGFIGCDGKDYFVHFRQIKSNGFKTLKEGQAVTFEIGKSPKGEVANEVMAE